MRHILGFLLQQLQLQQQQQQAGARSDSLRPLTLRPPSLSFSLSVWCFSPPEGEEDVVPHLADFTAD